MADAEDKANKTDTGELVVRIDADAAGLLATFDTIEKRIDTLITKFAELRAAADSSVAPTSQAPPVLQPPRDIVISG